MQIKAKCKYDYATCKAISHTVAYKKQNPKKTFIIRLILYIILEAANLFLIYNYGGDLLQFALSVLLVVAFGFEIMVYFLLPGLQYKSLSKMKDLENEYLFRDEDFTAETASEEYNGDSVIKYSFLEKVMETNKYLFLFQNKRQVFAVDKFTLEGGTAEELREKLSLVLDKKYIVCKY